MAFFKVSILVCSKLIVSLTPSEFHIDALTYATRAKHKYIKFSTKTAAKLDELTLIQSKSSWHASASRVATPFENYNQAFWRSLCETLQTFPVYALGFTHNYKVARDFFDFARDNSLPLVLIQGDTELHHNSLHTANESGVYKHLMNTQPDSTHSTASEKVVFVGTPFGIMGTGLNLSSHKIVFIHHRIFKPMTHYWSTRVGKDDLQELALRERLSIILQNVGRFARRSASEVKSNQPTRRVAFILGRGLEETTRDLLLASFRSMFKKVGIIDLDALEKVYTIRSSPSDENSHIHTDCWHLGASRVATPFSY